MIKRTLKFHKRKNSTISNETMMMIWTYQIDDKSVSFYIEKQNGRS